MNRDKINKKPVIILTGATASGKSDLGVEIAKILDGEIINSDSMQIYKGLPILTSCPKKDNSNIKNHLYEEIEVDVRCSVGMWLEMALEKIQEIQKRGKTVIILGGTPMYNRVLVDGISKIQKTTESVLISAKEELNKIGKQAFFDRVQEIDPESAKRIHPSDSIRALRIYTAFLTTGKPLSELIKTKEKSILQNYQVVKLCLLPERKIVYENCYNRFLEMLSNKPIGVIEEVKCLLEKNIHPSLPINGAIGIKEISMFLNKQISTTELIELTTQSTRQYAKHQYTWFNNRFKDFIKLNDKDINIAIKAIHKELNKQYIQTSKTIQQISKETKLRQTNDK